VGFSTAKGLGQTEDMEDNVSILEQAQMNADYQLPSFGFWKGLVWHRGKLCKKCSGILLPGAGRCPCASVKPRYKTAADGAVDAQHFYTLMKSLRDGSWLGGAFEPDVARYKTPHSTAKSATREVFDAFGGGGFSIQKEPRWPSVSLVSVQFFIFQCEVSKQCWRNEFDGLMGMRMTLWLAGLSQREVCDRLQIPRKDLCWLDEQIRRFLPFPSRSGFWRVEYLKSYRKFKAGVALDIIRRKRHNYKQGQALQPQ